MIDLCTQCDADWGRHFRPRTCKRPRWQSWCHPDPTIKPLPPSGQPAEEIAHGPSRASLVAQAKKFSSRLFEQ
jgi:hypothetical protein